MDFDDSAKKELFEETLNKPGGDDKIVHAMLNPIIHNLPPVIEAVIRKEIYARAGVTREDLNPVILGAELIVIDKVTKWMKAQGLAGVDKFMKEMDEIITDRIVGKR